MTEREQYEAFLDRRNAQREAAKTDLAKRANDQQRFARLLVSLRDKPKRR